MTQFILSKNTEGKMDKKRCDSKIKKPLHVKILEKMEEAIPGIKSSVNNENKMRELGSLFLGAELPLKVKEEIICCLNKFKETISDEGDTHSAHKYLEYLVEKLSQ